MCVLHVKAFPGVLCLGIFLFVFILGAERSAEAVEQLAPRSAVPTRPVTVVVPAEAPPTIDGVLDDKCWEESSVIRPFTLTYQSAFAPYRAEAMLAFSEQELYVGMRVFDIETSDGLGLVPVGIADPCVAEFLIAAEQPETFYKVAVNSKGETFTSQSMAKALPWRVVPRAAMQRHEAHWEAEFAIPFDGVDLAKPTVTCSSPAVRWHINIGWRTATRTNYAAWATTHAWFYEPQFFGEILFGGRACPHAELLSVSAAQVGKNALPVRLWNEASTTRRFETTVVVDDNVSRRVVFCRKDEVNACQTLDIPCSYELEDGLRGVATVEVRTEGEAQPFFRQSVVVDLPRVRALVSDTRALLYRLQKSRLSKRSSAGIERRQIAKELNQIAKGLEATHQSRQAWLTAEPLLRRLLARAQKLDWLVTHGWKPEERAFVGGVVSSLQKIIRDTAYLGHPDETLSLSAMRGEVEGFHLLVIPLYQRLTDIRLEASALEGPSGAQIPAENVSIFWEGFVESRPARYPTDGTRWYGDPLIPLEYAPSVLEPDTLHQPFWVSVRVPYGIPHGIYTGTLTVSAQNAPPWRVKLRLRVFDVDLPERPVLKTSLWLNPERTQQWYGWDTIPADVARRQMAFLLEHRVNPCWFGPVGDEEDVAWQLQHGLNCVMLGVADVWPVPPKMDAQIQRWYDFFKAHGLLHMTYIYAQDEPSPQDYPKVRQTMERVAERWPGARRMCTAFPPVPLLEGAVDTWVVGPNLFDYDAVAARVQAGDELWLYLSASVRRPYAAQLYLDYTALEHRLIGWYCWKYGATGFLYWGINEWESNRVPWSGRSEIDDAIRAGKRWPEVPWNSWTYLDCNGEAQYIYPGRNGEFWSSVRFEVLRDSFEDYDYLALLREASKELAAARIPHTEALLRQAERLLILSPPLLSDLTCATNEPNVLLQRREAIAECLEEMEHVLAIKAP